MQVNDSSVTHLNRATGKCSSFHVTIVLIDFVDYVTWLFLNDEGGSEPFPIILNLILFVERFLDRDKRTKWNMGRVAWQTIATKGNKSILMINKGNSIDAYAAANNIIEAANKHISRGVWAHISRLG